MGTIEPRLSILIPSIPSRFTKTTALITRLQEQVGDRAVEILCLCDNKTRSIGLKREALVQSARGMYLAFVDDDDEVMDDYVAELYAATFAEPAPDVIVFDQLVTINQLPPVIVRHGIEFENTEVGLDGATRKPWHVMAYARRIAQASHFPDASYAEDKQWVDQAWPQVRVQHRINKVLHHYRYSDAVTEAEVTYPPNTHPAEADNDPAYNEALLRTAESVLAICGPGLPEPPEFAVLRPPSVIDIGCNSGRWCRAFKRLGCKPVIGIDSPHMINSLLPDAVDDFVAKDLRTRFAPVARGDLVLCLEVAEHIPSPYVEEFMDTVCAHGDTVLFSAATPGQGGWQHFNEQPFDYWIAKFELRGYTADTSIRYRLDPGLPEYYRRTMALFTRQET